MCICCQERKTPIGFVYCTSCQRSLTLEVAEGLQRLADYLAHWAAFSEWCDRRSGVPA
jgi:transcription elongation factor Elf1